jgi:hypothetical protein
MNFKDEMLTLFGEEKLVYALLSKVDNINLSAIDKEFLINTGFPNIFSYFRFSMEFEPLSEDFKMGQMARHLSHLLTFGCEGISQMVNRFVMLSEIHLPSNASLSDIARKIEELKIDDAVFRPETVLAPRICLDSRNGSIRAVYPSDLSIKFMNSSIQQLAASIIAYQRNFSIDYGGLRLDRFKQDLAILDSKALEHEDNIWVTIIERLTREKEGY